MKQINSNGASSTVLKYIYLESSVILVSQVQVKEEEEEKAWQSDCLGVS